MAAEENDIPWELLLDIELPISDRNVPGHVVTRAE